MLVMRAKEVLEALRLHEGIAITPEEQGELLANHLITVYNDADYSDMKAGALDVEMLTQQVRDLSRDVGSQAGPVSSGFRRRKDTVADATRERYQETLAKLEEASGKKAALEMVVYNQMTRSYVSLALVGRKAITDMTAWSARFGSDELSVFIGRMKSMRNSMETAVQGASKIVEDFISPRPGMIKPELRGPALLASQAGADTEDFESAFGGTPEGGFRFDDDLPSDEPDDYYPDDASSDWLSEYEDTDNSSSIEPEPEEEDSGKDADDLFMTTYLTSGKGGENYRTMRYFEAISALRNTSLDTGEMDLKAAAVAEVPRGQESVMIDRMKWLKMNMVLPDESDIAWLASSKYSLDEVKSRFESLDKSLVASGHQEDSHLRTACAIMTGSPRPIETLTKNFDALASQLKYVFDVPTVAAAMLASGPLEPDEAMHVFKEAVGVISRANYFDDAGEIENLALLLANRYGPDASAVQPSASTSSLVQSPADQVAQQQAVEDQQRSPFPYYWYYWHNRYYGRPLFYNFRVHPGHMHTVPHFG